MTKYEVVICRNCNKPLFPIELINNDRSSWCSCNKINVPYGWSGYVEKSYKKKWNK